MRKLISLALAFALFSFLAPVNIIAQAQQSVDKGLLNGVAKDAAGNPMQNITVQLLDSNGNVVATATTNNLGEYVMTNLNPGQYTVQLLDAGKLVGIAGNVTVAAGVATTATVTGVTAAVAAAGIIIPVATTALIIGATLAIAGATIAIVAAAPTASPSR